MPHKSQIFTRKTKNKNYNHFEHVYSFFKWRSSPLDVAKPNNMEKVLGGCSASYILHTRAFGTYLLGAIYLAKNIIRHGIFQNKGKCLSFNTPYQ